MAVQAITRIEAVRTVSGNRPLLVNFPEAATRTFKKGAILIFNAAGFVDEAGANPVNIIGVADADAQNTTNAGDVNTPVLISQDDTLFRANAVSVSAGAAVAANSVAGSIAGVPTLVGNMYGLTKLTTSTGSGNWVVDLAKQGTNRRVIITNYDPRGTGYPLVTDTYPIVEFLFFQFFAAFGATS